MNAKTKTTAALLASAGAVTAIALVLDRSSASGSTTNAPKDIHACGVPAPSRAEATLDHGRLGVAMSARKLLRGGGGEAYAAFELTTDATANAPRAPLDIAFVIDRSGSMSGRIEHAQAAANGIVDHLGPQDHVALVQYDDMAQVVTPSLAMDAAGKERMHAAIANLRLGGGTNLHAGLELGRDEVIRASSAGHVSRVILLSDGMANEGVTDPGAIASTARQAADRGVRITSVGIGLDFNEDLMEAIAEAGRGNYHFVKEASDLEKVVAGELAGVQATVATNVELHLSPGCAGAQIVAVHGYESHRDGDALVVPMTDLFGGDSRKLLVQLKVPDAHEGQVGALHAELVYRDAKGGELRRKAVQVGVEISPDASATLASIDQNVMAQVLQIQAAASMRQAAEAYQRGDRDSAVQILDESTHRIREKSARYKLAPKQAAPALGGLDEMSKQAKSYDPASAGGKEMLKASKAKARVMTKK